MNDDNNKIAVYIPTKNSSIYLREVLNSFKFLEKKEIIKEILIVDCSSKEEKENIKRIIDSISKEIKKKIRIINQKTFGLASARNIAIKSSKSKIIASIDADCIPEKKWLRILYETLANENASGVGGKVIELERLKNISLGDRWRAKHLRQDFGNKKIINPKFISGANNIFYKKDLEKIGFYNENYKSNYEDVDISKRLLKKGYKLIYEPNAIVYHIKKDSVFSVLKTNWAWGFYGNEPKNLYAIIKRCVFNFYITLKYFFNDLLDFDFKLAIIDILVLPTNFYFDLRWLLKKQ
ncbi:MAG: glycosyltransferase [Candidatus Woesearchaeota archaeon]